MMVCYLFVSLLCDFRVQKSDISNEGLVWPSDRFGILFLTGLPEMPMRDLLIDLGGELEGGREEGGGEEGGKEEGGREEVPKRSEGQTNPSLAIMVRLAGVC